MDRTDATTYDAPPSKKITGARAFVTVVTEEGTQAFDLPAEMEMAIGRSRSSAIPISDRAASRLHATLRWDGAGMVVVDDKASRHGTYVEGSRVTRPTALTSGAEVTIGETHLLIAILGARAPSATGDDSSDAIDDASLVARDPAMLRAVALADRAARTDVTVLLIGETGAGKEVLARRVHGTSARAPKPFVAVNCASIPETLAESTLFGHERGAFTGALARQTGYFEAAHGGTLFLDEVGELSAAVQARLLRVLEVRAVTRVGSNEPVPVDVRVVAATNRDLDADVRHGTFRKDLLFRLDVVRILVPALRARPDDIAPLAERFLLELAPDRPILLAPDAREALRARAWPGNVRELRNVLTRAVALLDGNVLGAGDLGNADALAAGRGGGALRETMGGAERAAVVQALDAAGGNQSKAARRLGISRRALIYKLEKYGLKAPPRK